MTDLVVAVRLKADGSGLVGQMRLSKESVDELKRATEKAGNSAEGMAADMTRAGAAAEKAGASAERAASSILDMAVANARAERAAKELKTAQEALAAAVEAGSGEQVAAANRVAAAQQNLVQAQGEVTRASRQAEQAGTAATRSLGAQRAGYAQLGFQIQDITQSIALGTNAFTILAQQGGQTASAVSQLGLTGVGGRVAAFFAGPWGAAILAGTAVLGPFVAELFNTKKAVEEVTLAGDALADAQGVLGKVFDLTTGKLKDNTAALLLNARAKEINLRASALEKQQSAIGVFGRVDQADTFSQIVGTLQSGYTGVNAYAVGRQVRDLAARAEAARQLTAPSRTKEEQALGARQLDGIIQEASRADFRSSSVTRKQFIDAVIAVADSRNENAVANLINKSLADGRLAPELRQDAKAKKPKSGAALAQFGESAGDRLAAIVTRYQDLPAPVREVEQSLNQLDAIARELEQRKPPNYAALKQQLEDARAAVIGGRDRGLAQEIEKIGDGFDQTGAAAKRASEGTERLSSIVRYLNANLKDNPGFEPLIEQAERAQAAIDASVLRPYRELVTGQREQIEANNLILRGREDEAQALQLINGLKRAGLVLTQQQQDAILLGVQATRQQARELEVLQRRQQNLIGFLGDARGSIARAFAGESTDIAGDIVQSFRRAFAEQLTEQLFGNLFRDLTDRVLGRSKIEAPADRFKAAVDQTINPLGNLAGEAASAAASLRQVAASGVAGSDPATRALLAANKISPNSILGATVALFGQRATGLGGGSAYDGAEVTVTANRLKRSDDTISSLQGLLREFLTKGLKIESSSLNKLGDVIGTGLKGAGTGLAVAGLGQALGIKLDSGGAAIGGAAGGLLGKLFPKIPGLDIVGGLVGGLFGSLFAPTPKAKSGAITSVDGKVEISGNNGDAKNSVAQAVGQVQAGLQQIADQLGADIGNFSVSIAKYKTSFRVDPTGSGSDGGKYGDKLPGLGKFDDNDIQGAVGFAIADAIKDGAIKGISPAVAKALQSSTDVNKALREALKVRDLEAFIGGPAAALKKSFDDFDRLADERVELAKKYSLDLVELEKKTGEARAKLVADTLQANTGELQSLLDSIKFGDLFEGTAAEKRRQLIDQVDKAQADQAAGVEGAGAKLAQLYQQLLSNSRDAFGTAGSEYAADRSRAVAGAEAAIKAEQDRINRAAGLQQAAVDAAQQSNTLLDEIASLTATTNGKLDTLIGAVQGGGEGDLSRITTTLGDYGNWWDAPQLGLTIRNSLV
ncbi:MAG: hypothetical protein K2X73_04795 [Sphingomonas sp.]|uniref:hypothetical protein n=1 Tax=Sphingomonas sp. TaxID=28214 RepID=UPI0025D2206C|nr:hypothetical protein [Sphingomonas sp.]MBX9881272.1 hypothetical protein [Sphingomonas sp.]